MKIIFTLMLLCFSKSLFCQLNSHRDTVIKSFPNNTIIVLKTDSVIISEWSGFENRYYFNKKNICYMWSQKQTFSEFGLEFWNNLYNSTLKSNGTITCPCGGKSKLITNCKSWIGEGELVSLTYTNTECETGFITIIHIRI